MATLMRKQRGAAGIYMALLLIPLFGAVFLGLEGTRYFQKQNRLADGTEAAALAVTIANHGNTSSYEKDLAEKYIQAYVRDIKGISQLDVTTKEGQTTIPSSEGDIEKNYTQYKVTAKTSHNSWFSSTLIPSFSPVETVANQAVARNYPEILGDKYVDIVFVADFSGSMSGRKFTAMKKAIKDIAGEILVPREGEDKVKNRIGFVPFNMRVQEKINSQRVCMTQLDYLDNVNNQGNYSPYESINWDEWSQYRYDYVYYCANGYYCYNNNKKRTDARTVWDVINKSRYSTRNRGFYPDPLAYIDIYRTANNVFTEKKHELHFKSNRKALYSQGICNGNFWTIPLTSDKDDLNDIYYKMNPSGGTSVYQGILRGAQILSKGEPSNSGKDEEEYNNRLKMILILSDGQEDPFTNTFYQLAYAGMCDTMRKRYKDDDLPLHMGVIGIEFSASQQAAFQKCVKKQNIIDVADVSNLLGEIKKLIKKGSETDGISKLHYRYTD